jgi:hypothetical protein
LHKKLLLHPLSIFTILCCGVFMAGWTYQVLASTLISSTIEAPELQDAATLDSPPDGTVFTKASVTVSGSCPADSYVNLSVNGAFSGVAWCSSSGAYSVATSLYAGTNTLKVQDFNITDEPGPVTPSIQVIYTPPVVAPTTSTVGSTSAPTAVSSASPTVANPVGSAPLLLTSDFQFHTFTAAQTFTWQLDLEGGTPPYDVSIDWGDDSSSKLRFPGDPIFSVQHRYTAAGYYPVVVKSTDSIGQVRTTQLAALITNTNGQAAFLNPTNNAISGTTDKTPITNRFPTTSRWLLLAWPFYLVVGLMLFSFWLGERREFALIHARRKR